MIFVAANRPTRIAHIDMPYMPPQQIIIIQIKRYSMEQRFGIQPQDMRHMDEKLKSEIVL